MKDFISFPFALYEDDAFHAPQLRRDQQEHFSLRNPFFQYAKVSFFLALREGRPVGRIAAILNRKHIEYHREKAGFFGFFEAVNDPDVAAGLLDRAAEVLKAEGMDRMRGPMSFSTNEECGFLMEGFDQPPLIMTPYNPPYYHELMKQCGMEKAADLMGFIFDVERGLPEKVLRVSAMAERRNVTVREIDKKIFLKEMASFQEVYNEAWQQNWGFIPLSDDELQYLATRLKTVIRPELVFIAEDRGTPVGFLGLLPDFNTVLRQMKGKITPLTLFRGICVSRKITDLRLLLFGIKKEYRNRGVDALLLREAFRNVQRGKYRRIEFSWVLEDNLPVQRLIDLAGGRMYKRYRIYEKKIG